MDGSGARPDVAGKTSDEAMRIAKHREIITCPWCNAGATMTFVDSRGEFCMGCKRNLRTGEAMAAPLPEPPDDPRAIE